ncbi:MAG: type II secretion system F family protein [Candidatus Dormiibacterota bacterium]
MTVAVLVAVFCGAGILMIAVALAQMSSRSAIMQERLRRAALPVAVTSPELSRPLAERILVPLDDFFRRRTPAERLRRAQDRISLAGRPFGLTVGRLLVIKAVLGVVVTLVMALFLHSSGINPLGYGVFSVALTAVVLGIGGYYLPDLFLNQALRRRREAIRRQLPEVCDLLSICVDAGAPFDVALAKVVESEYMAGPLVDELRGVLRQIQYATGRLDALQRMADRVDVEELRIFVVGLGESFKRGAPIADELRVQSDDIRRRYRDHAEELANQATIKMLLPLVFLIFPTLFIVILTPAMIQAFNTIQGGP